MSVALAQRAPRRFSFADFELPRELRAIVPPEIRGHGRSDVRLLVADGRGITHRHFEELPEVLRAGDVLVVNTSATIPARTVDGTDLVINLSTELPGGLWVVEPREPAGPVSKPPAAAVERGAVVLPQGGSAQLLVPYPAGTRRTELKITPERGVHVVEGLLTGWHEPESSHLDLLRSVGGDALVLRGCLGRALSLARVRRLAPHPGSRRRDRAGVVPPSSVGAGKSRSRLSRTTFMPGSTRYPEGHGSGWRP